jgi:hypothetical protein
MGKATNRNRKARIQVANVATHEPPADQLALERRAAMYGLTKEQAKDQRAATHIGRMTMRGELASEQYDGLQRMIALCAQYSQAMSTPGIPRFPKDGASAGDAESFERWCKDVRADYRAAVLDITKASNRLKINLWNAFSICALSDQATPFPNGELQVVANVLIDHFGIDAGRKAA